MSLFKLAVIGANVYSHTKRVTEMLANSTKKQLVTNNLKSKIVPLASKLTESLK